MYFKYLCIYTDYMQICWADTKMSKQIHLIRVSANITNLMKEFEFLITCNVCIAMLKKFLILQKLRIHLKALCYFMLKRIKTKIVLYYIKRIASFITWQQGWKLVMCCLIWKSQFLTLMFTHFIFLLND